MWFLPIKRYIAISINEKGYRTITDVLSLKGEETTEVPNKATKSYTKTTKTTTDSKVFEKRDNSMEAGGIMHDAVALAVGIGVAGLTEEEAVSLVNRLAAALLAAKRELQG